MSVSGAMAGDAINMRETLRQTRTAVRLLLVGCQIRAELNLK